MRAAIVVLLAVLLAVQARAAAAAPERLIVSPYPGPPAWKRITDKASPAGWLHEQIPVGQSVGAFTDILTDQAFRKLAGRDPAQFLQLIFGSVVKACDGVKVNGPVTRAEGGYVVAYAQVYCGQQRGADFGVHIFYKAISGAAGLYSVSREFHVPASSDGRLTFPRGQAARAEQLLNAEAAANDYLEHGVYVCGGRSTDTRCER
jgi:hypothetical protein